MISQVFERNRSKAQAFLTDIHCIIDDRRDLLEDLKLNQDDLVTKSKHIDEGNNKNMI